MPLPGLFGLPGIKGPRIFRSVADDSVEEAKGPFFGRPSAEEVENSVLVHEVGHLLGRVNIVYQSLVELSLIHISEPTRRRGISYAVFCLKKKRKSRNPRRGCIIYRSLL